MQAPNNILPERLGDNLGFYPKRVTTGSTRSSPEGRIYRWKRIVKEKPDKGGIIIPSFHKSIQNKG